MMKKTMSRLMIFGLLVGFASVPDAYSQDTASEVTLRFKVFDANKPDVQLTPINGILFLRDRVTLKPERRTRVTFGEPKNGFSELKIKKGKLIEQLVINIPGFNPAVIAKTVTAADIQVFPGASAPDETFSFPAFLGQLGAYKSLYNIFENELGETRREEIKSLLREDFGEQLLIMATAERNGKLIAFTPGQMQKARKAVKEVLTLYGLFQEEEYSPTIVLCKPAVCRRIRSRCRHRFRR